MSVSHSARVCTLIFQAQKRTKSGLWTLQNHLLLRSATHDPASVAAQANIQVFEICSTHACAIASEHNRAGRSSLSAAGKQKAMRIELQSVPLPLRMLQDNTCLPVQDFSAAKEFRSLNDWTSRSGLKPVLHEQQCPRCHKRLNVGSQVGQARL